MTAITCKNLCKTFHQGEAVITGLDQVSIAIESGEFVCLSGPSGSGKTTLLNAMGGLDTPDRGEIMVGDKRVDILKKVELAEMRLQNIGFVFQAYNLIPVLTASENIEFVMQVQGLAKVQRAERVRETLAEVGLSGMGSRLPSQLSGGQQQRVAVARAIASNPKLVLADEPTANLDSKTADQLMDLFSELNKRRKVTFVIATHDQRVMAHCKRLVRMEDGCIVSDQIQSLESPQGK
ncbi:ABC transporter ATP-binding protein [Teredinibacter haidensis]|uniref:ABC transporter ATP-binding protein n=1 Tax=Teredinibacter haidensis TaxID=2731755 RepID=UPI0009489B86|nr:ABC transporter ATP-binding protein [Teredinibacter haidensis]